MPLLEAKEPIIIKIKLLTVAHSLLYAWTPMSDPGQSFYFLCSNRFVDWLQAIVEAKGLISLHEIYYESLSENHGMSIHTPKISKVQIS